MSFIHEGGKSYGIIATQALVPLEPGESKSIAWNQKDGGEDGEQAIPGNYRASVGPGSFADFKIQGPTIDVNIIIVNKINNQIRNYFITTIPLPSCTTLQERTIPLGPGTMANNGTRLLSIFNPCRLVDGSAIFNLPSNNNLNLLAVDLEGSGSNIQAHKAVVIELQRTQTITNDQTLYKVDLNQTMTGISVVTGKIDIIQDINALFLWNYSPRQINFVNENSMILNATLSSSN